MITAQQFALSGQLINLLIFFPVRTVCISRAMLRELKYITFVTIYLTQNPPFCAILAIITFFLVGKNKHNKLAEFQRYLCLFTEVCCSEVLLQCKVKEIASFFNFLFHYYYYVIAIEASQAKRTWAGERKDALLLMVTRES